MTHDVFISHSSKDRAVAEAARAAIEDAGYRCWMAPRDILPGQDYGEAIVDGIRGSRVFLLIFSSASVDSAQVRRETERAANAGIAIIPFRIEDVKPSKSLEFFISSAHWLDAFDPPIQRHFDYLVAVIGQQLGGAEAGPAPRTIASPRPAPPRSSGKYLVPLVGAGIVLAMLAGSAAYYWSQPGTGDRECSAIPDTAQTGFVLRATPKRSDKPLWLRAGPSATATPVTAIGPDEVFRISQGQTGQWWAAQLCDGTTGFVQARHVNLLDRPAAPEPATP